MGMAPRKDGTNAKDKLESVDENASTASWSTVVAIQVSDVPVFKIDGAGSATKTSDGLSDKSQRNRENGMSNGEFRYVVNVNLGVFESKSSGVLKDDKSGVFGSNDSIEFQSDSSSEFDLGNFSSSQFGEDFDQNLCL